MGNKEKIMPKCPECNTYSYDETSFFCYRCGAKLPVHLSEKESISEKKKEPSQNYTTPSPANIKTDDFLKLPKSAAIQLVHPIEICAQCGGPVNDKNRIFCRNCDSDNRKARSEEISLVMNHSFPESPIKSMGSNQNPDMTTNRQQPLLSEGLCADKENSQSPSAANSWRSIFILAAMALLFFIIMLILLLFPFPP
jgi:hypothetical protein